MINFIVVDDQKFFVESIINIIDQTMINNKLEYKTHTYNDYDSAFFQIVNEQIDNKIYILDIQTPSRNGNEVAREIRKTDLKSKIIFITAYEEVYGMDILKATYEISNFISKQDDYQNILKEAILNIIKIFQETDYLQFDCSTYKMIVAIDDINYIATNKISKKSIVVAKIKSFEINSPLNSLLEKLNDNFVYSHKSCIVNKKNITFIDKTKSMIYFNNNTCCDLLSRKYKNSL